MPEINTDSTLAKPKMLLTPPDRQRNGFLNWVLLFFLAINLVNALSFPVLIEGLRTEGQNVHWLLESSVTLAYYANVLFISALMLWKRWGFWGFALMSAINFIAQILQGRDIEHSIYGFAGVLFIFILLNIGGKNCAWNQLE